MYYTNINLTDNNNVFTYMIGYEDIVDPTYNEETDIIYWNKGLNYKLLVDNDLPNLLRNENVWNYLNNNRIIYNVYTKFAKINVYFPNYSIDTFSSGTKYVIGVNLNIGKKIISLGEYLLDRMDACATSVVDKYSNFYQEVISFDIINPNNILYGEEWAEFRENINPGNINDWGNALSIYLFPVTDNGGAYIKKDGYDGGYNSINIYKSDNYLNLHISHNLNVDDGNIPQLYLNINYNTLYNDLTQYISNTYGIKEYQLFYNLYIKDKDNIYMGPIEYESTDSDIYINLRDLSVDSWAGYKEGLSIVATASIVVQNKEIIYLKSHELPITPEMYCYMLKLDDNIPSYINLKDINMNNLNINVVNKTEQKIIKLNKPDDSKSNIIQPVFFKARDLNNIIIHPEVTEYISINLDSFKPMVKTFIIQIEGCKFVETGRSAAGVIFKIVGNNLPKSATAGNYYILNENYELITNGKYKYE